MQNSEAGKESEDLETRRQMCVSRHSTVSKTVLRPAQDITEEGGGTCLKQNQTGLKGTTQKGGSSPSPFPAHAAQEAPGGPRAGAAGGFGDSETRQGSH